MITTSTREGRTRLGDTSGRVLLVCDDAPNMQWLATALDTTGHVVDQTTNAADALNALHAISADIVVVDLADDDLDFVRDLRAGNGAHAVPIMLLATDRDADHAVHAIELGVDDYVRKPVAVEEFLARVRGKMDRPPSPAEHIARHHAAGLLSEPRLREELAREIGRASRSGRSGCLAALDVAERSSVAARLGLRADQDLRVQVSALAATGAGEFDLLCMDDDGRLLVLMPDTDPERAKERLIRLSDHVARGSFTAAGEAVNVTPVVGFAVFGAPATDPDDVVHRALVAADVALAHLDLQPVEWDPRFVVEERPAPKIPLHKRVTASLRTPLQIMIMLDIGVVLPFIAYVLLYKAGWNIAPFMYLVVVAALLVTATLIWIEGFLALDPGRPPAEPEQPYPPASAIIAAYLPNEAATVIQTVEAFLRMDYPAGFQVVLAYNTPQPMPVEDVLAQIAERDPRLVLYRVEGSTSKAQNVNAALGVVDGEFVGVFDADHHPEPDAFKRAWRWLSSGYDVVQGHCAVRNGDSSVVARTVAIEFEAIYAVSHPGRARLHTFGIFGGSNGYWRTDLLRRVRMHGFMLTEDIDSSLRVVENGGRIASDPALVSWELAPTTVKALWNQRMRWAQGWFQVSRKHLLRGWKSQHMTLRQKTGFTLLLAWREVYPWLSLQVLPLLAFFAWRAGSVTEVDLLVPFFVLTTLFTLSVGPGQTFFAYRLAVPELRRRKVWFFVYLFTSTIVYTEMKNIIGRVAQIKELTGDRQWKVTPRSVERPRVELEPAE